MRRTATSEVTNICSQGIESNEKERRREREREREREETRKRETRARRDEEEGGELGERGEGKGSQPKEQESEAR